ncbi:hypothetical protein K1T71_004214 [Dendrolimus kikuchii]|uniref:Uncharacterized protein n=1 Tax=Dendrolimus kikuchii TaxID=765133 RepID=A0ACC1DAC3_9NEOP|nr:hypothetical protein K1T71_004214 [Dendrolimus kikuchii]
MKQARDVAPIVRKGTKSQEKLVTCQFAEGVRSPGRGGGGVRDTRRRNNCDNKQAVMECGAPTELISEMPPPAPRRATPRPLLGESSAPLRPPVTLFRVSSLISMSTKSCSSIPNTSLLLRSH